MIVSEPLLLCCNVRCLSALQGLFERHKLIVATQLCMAVLRSRGELQRQKFEFLLRGPKEMGVDNPLTDWVSESVWGSVQALKELEDYASLPDDLVGSSKRWREWMELERPGESYSCGAVCVLYTLLDASGLNGMMGRKPYPSSKYCLMVVSRAAF